MCYAISATVKLQARFPLSPITGPEQSIKIDDKKINLSIDGNRIRLVNWHRLASGHIKVFVNFIDWLSTDVHCL